MSCCVRCSDLTILLATSYYYFRVAVVSKSFEGQTDRTEEWYGTQYKQEAITDEVIKVRQIDFSKCSGLMLAYMCYSTFLLKVHAQTLSSVSFRTSGKWIGNKQLYAGLDVNFFFLTSHCRFPKLLAIQFFSLAKFLTHTMGKNCHIHIFNIVS